jgi:hypothetical protein
MKTNEIYEEMYDDNDKFDFSSYPKSHPNSTRNIIIGYTDDDNKPIVHNTKVPAKFTEEFDYKIPIDMSVCKAKGWAFTFYDKSVHEKNIEQIEVREYHNKLSNKNYNMMIFKFVKQLVISNILIFIPLEALTVTYIHFIVIK